MVTKSTLSPIVNVRELPPDDTEEEDSGMTEDAAKYATAIAGAKRRHPDLVQAINATECFAVSWEDEEAGRCTAGDDCALTRACAAAWNTANGKTVKQKHTAAVAAPIVQTNNASVVRKLHKDAAPVHRRARNKWKGTGRYVRLQYVSTGRPIDTALSHLLEGLGKPSSLPRDWHYSQLDKYVQSFGRMFLNPTPCYTAVLVDKRVLLRFWTNAASCASIDFAPEISGIVLPLKGFGRPRPIPAGSLQKCSPCTHRIMLSLVATTHQESLQLLGAQLRMAFKL